MTDEFRVSVIIPVFNAANRVGNAVRSTLVLSEVDEVILVEDASSDQSLNVCSALAAEHPKVRLLRHPDGGNHGAGSSRNLGVEKARAPFVAFLDADDAFLPGRFDADRIIFADPQIDGVYSAIANEYESDAVRVQWLEQGWTETLSISETVPPDELIFVLLWAHPTASGDFHVDTVTVRREFFLRVGGFHPGLRLQQDTQLWRRMAVAGKLAAGNLTRPVALRYVHSGNRMTRKADHDSYYELWWSTLGTSLRSLKANPQIMTAWRQAHATFRSSQPGRVKALQTLCACVIDSPATMLEEYGHFDLTLRRIFPGSRIVLRFLSGKNRLARTIGRKRG